MNSPKANQPLTEEQKARIEANRQRAIALQAAAKESLKVESKPITINNNSSSSSNQNSEEEIYCEQLIDSKVCGIIMSIQDKKLYWECFGERCCGSCRLSQGSDWDLISRAEVLSEYLIPADSIQLMKFSTRPNPHNPHWTAMKLFLRRHARLKAYTRFGGADELEKEIMRRKQVKFEKEFAQSNDIFNTSSIASGMAAGSSSGHSGHSGSGFCLDDGVMSGFTGDIRNNKSKSSSGGSDSRSGFKKKMRHSDDTADVGNDDGKDEDDDFGSPSGGGFLATVNDDDDDVDDVDIDQVEKGVNSFSAASGTLLTQPRAMVNQAPVTIRGSSSNKKNKRGARHIMADFATSLLASKGKL